ncbi:3-phosphoshikimate 1-carboxyvinyltransferase [Microbacterium protaetiae]|uniref:3-phosphoshikimate 1-carboxyvinyltransferase n=1 Tax=Microbacterium protaetiae TaxID=2509458 RepID=A0A4P6ELM6_9MICO|nr:3-phosphoshikimate 1-carboxyvinyltransferase [Microbacterium protaetiae]QAY58728.1 3-phosphoshikimate 1-carboxyvinyltransferase [Microbacterium protaetiae]
MHLSVAGSTARVHGTVRVPNSKYHAHRALILASLAPGTSRITGLSDARHVQYTVDLLRALGITVEIEGDTFVVHGGAYRPRRDHVTVGSSGTTLYFMVGLAALADRDVLVTGQKYFDRRPIGPLLRALRELGVDVSSPTDCPPIQVRHGRPTGGTVHIAGTLSQWISALLLIAPFAAAHTTVIVDGPFNERSYVDLTVRMMAQFGLNVAVSADGRRYDIAPGQVAHPADLQLPPDIGSAAFGLAVAGIRPADVVLTGLPSIDPADVDHPEAEFLRIVRAMGLPMEVDAAAGAVRVRHDGARLQATEVDCRAVPDMLPVLSTMAAFAEGESVFHNVEHVRLKESDRVHAMLQLNEMGAQLDFDGTDLRVRGVPQLRGAHLSSFNDHRVLMSLAVAASAASGRSTLTFPNAYRISYPQFLDAMADLHVDMQVEKGPARPTGRRRPPAGTADEAARITGAQWIRRWADERPHSLALVDAAPDRTTRMTWSELDHAVDKAAALLIELGVQSGDRVAVQLPNCSGFVVAAAAASRIGAVICPIMPIFRQREVAFALKRSGAKLVIVADNFRGRQHDHELADILAGPEASELAVEHVLVMHLTPGVAHVLPPCDNPDVTWNAWHRASAWVTVDRAALDARAPAPQDAAQLLFTSGTSGEPKGVLHTHESLSRAAWMEIEQLPLNSTDSVYIPSPLAHQTGFLYGMWLAWVLGVPEIVQRVWNGRQALEILEAWEGTFVQAATPFLTDLVREVEAGAPAPRALRIFVATGAAVPRALAERATRVLGTAVCGAFGTTETGLAALSTPADPAGKAWGTDGKALRDVRLRIVDDDGHLVAAGVEGNFELTSPTVFGGYLDRPDLSAEAFAADGWYRTGDLAVIDDDGFLHITGRVRDVINRGGEKVPVSEIEQLLYRHEAIDDVAIVAMPDERLGERACAFAVLVPGATLSFTKLQNYLDDNRVSKSYWPERLEIVDSLPRNAVGKVQKFLLRERAATLKPQRLTTLTDTDKEDPLDDQHPGHARRTWKPNRTA